VERELSERLDSHLRIVLRKEIFSLPRRVFARQAFALILLVLSASGGAADAGKASEAQSVLSFLNQSIVWYRQLTVQQQLANDPGDVLFLNDNRQLADRIVRLSFDYARARAQVLGAEVPIGTSGDQTQANRFQSLGALANKADQQMKELQDEIDNTRRQLETASGKKRVSLEASLAETQSEQQLAQARRDSLRSMAQFASGAAVGPGGAGTLESQIDELAHTIPAANISDKTASTQVTTDNSTAKVVATSPRNDTSTGILGLVSDLMALHRKSEAIEQDSEATDQLAAASRLMLTPLTGQARKLAAQGDQLAAQPDSTDPTVLAQQKAQVDAMTAQFKQVSASIQPLVKQSILLDIYNRSLANWRASVQSEYRNQLKSLILRLMILGIIIGMIATMSEIWKRATFRYVRDVRRRYQFLLLRRIATWTVIAIVVAAAFATELSTLATFAGLLTAGIAVALQNVILSVAGYFFLIGRYGVRVGDRVQVAGVTGDVIDIGMVRLHIMEVSSGGTDARATGRIVVFSNAVVFQANSGLFKQIPGTNFVWHDISLTLAADSNYHLVEKRMMDAVNSVYEKYKDTMESQRRRMEQNLSGISVRPLNPESRLRLTQSGLEAIIRYPVDIGNAAQIDDDMARAMLDAIAREPRLRLVGSGTPNIQAVADGHPA